MSLISNLIQENVTNTASEAALSTTSRGFGDATMGEENIQDEGSEIFSVKDTVMAPLRGLEGFAQSIYNLGDALTFDALPDWDRRFLGKSETVVGGLVEGATQFLTAFVPIGGVLGKAGQGLGLVQKGAKGLEAAGALAKASSGVQKAASIGRQALQGGIADFIAFDGQDARLSNLIETVPALRNPVTEYLQADPNDGELEGRFKNVVEGLFLEAGQQALAPLFTRGVKAVKEYKSKVNAGADPNATALEVADMLKSEVGEELKGLNPASAFDRAEQLTAGNVAMDANGVPVKTVPEPKDKLPDNFNPETGLPFETVKGGEQAVNTSLYNAISESKTIEQFDENLQKFADLIPYGKYDPRDQKYSAAQIKSNYAAAGIDPKVYDQLVASTTPEVFGRIMIKQDILKNVVRDSGEKLLALRTKTEGLTGFELKKAEELMFDELGRFERSLSAYSAIGTGASQTMLARKKGLSGGNMGDAKKPAKEVLNNFDTTLETVINDFDGKSVDELTAEVDSKGKPRKVKTAEEVATDYDNRISELEGELAVQQKLAFDERDAADYKVTVDDNGNPIPPTKERVKTIKERDLEGKIDFYKKAQKEHTQLQAAINEYEAVRKMGPERLKELEDLQAARNDLKIQLPPSRAKEVKARTAELKRKLKEDPAAKLKAAELKEAERLAKLTDAQKAKLEELRNQRSYGGKDAPEVEAKAIKAIDPELAGLKTQIAEHKAAIKEAADYEALVAKLEKLANTTPAQARKDAFELKARQALIPEKPVRSIDKLRSDIATLQKNLVDAGKEQMKADQVRSHEDLLEFAKQRLGSGTVKELKQTLSLANSIDDIEKRMSMVAYVQNTSMGRKLFNATYEFWLNNLFSPATHVVASLGGLSVMILKNTEAIVGNTIVGDFGRVKAHFNALTTFQGFQEAMEATVLAMKNNDSTLKSSNVSMGNIAKGDTQFEGRIQGGAISPEAFGVDPDSGFGRTLKWFGKAARVNSTLLVGGDEFIKQITYRQYLRTEFYAEGLQKGYLSGKELTQYVEDKLSGMVLEGGKMYNEKNLARAYVNKLKQQGLTADMPEFSQALAREYEKNPFDKTKGVLGEAAYQYSLKSTFTNETGDAFTKSVMDILEAYPVLKFVVPFIKTPTNVLKFGLSRTPMGVAKDSILLATSAKYRKMYVEGSAEVKADMVGRMATASAFTAGVMYYISNNEGAITGSGPQNKEERAALKATGWQPYSIKIGDKYVSYNRLDPIATPLGIMADFSEFNKVNAPKSDSDAENGMSAFLVAMTYNLTDKSYLRGLNNLMNVARDPETYGPKLFQDIAGGIMPNTINKLQDTESKIILRESRSIADAVMRRTPVLSEMLPPQRSFIGEPIYRDNPLGLLSAVSPVYISSIKNDVVDKELSELKHGFAMPPSKINGIADLDMREFTNESGQQAYDRFLELSGTIEINGSTLRQSLAKMMKSSEYKSIPKDNLQDTLGTNSPRIAAINRMVKAYRNRAQQEVFAEYPELYQKSKELTQMQRDYRLGKLR